MGTRRWWQRPDGTDHLVAVVVAMAMVTAVGAYSAVAMVLLERDSHEQAQQEIAVVQHALEQYRIMRGAYPPVDVGLKALVEADILMSTPRDMWDRPYRYALKVWPADGGEYPVVSSDGQDGVPGTDDDVSER